MRVAWSEGGPRARAGPGRPCRSGGGVVGGGVALMVGWQGELGLPCVSLVPADF